MENILSDKNTKNSSSPCNESVNQSVYNDLHPKKMNFLHKPGTSSTRPFSSRENPKFRGRDDRYIDEKLFHIQGPTSDLPPKKAGENKFAGRARLYFGNFPPSVTDDELHNLFKQYGETSDMFVNRDKAFGFIKIDYFRNAEKAKLELNGFALQGRMLNVKFARPAAVTVKNLSLYVSNELLAYAFGIFGEIERCYIKTDERGKHLGEGIIEFAKKGSAEQAIKYCKERCFFLTGAIKPAIVEERGPDDDTDGISEAGLKKTHNYYQERKEPPRFAQSGSFYFEYAQRWKNLYEQFNDQVAALKRVLHHEEKQLEAEVLHMQYDHETDQLREILRRRELDRGRFQQEWGPRGQQLQKGERQMDVFGRTTHQDTLFEQANELENLLDNQEQKLQTEHWHKMSLLNDTNVVSTVTNRENWNNSLNHKKGTKRHYYDT